MCDSCDVGKCQAFYFQGLDEGRFLSLLLLAPNAMKLPWCDEEERQEHGVVAKLWDGDHIFLLSLN